MVMTEYQAQLRKRQIMKDVLPDEAMWAAWIKTDSKARQGKGFHPQLDRYFLELLVGSEIDLLGSQHDIETVMPVERIQRATEKVRRVAEIRIGRERLQAYGSRVVEAFESYVRGENEMDGWGMNTWDNSAASDSGESEGDRDMIDIDMGLDGGNEPADCRGMRGRDKEAKRIERSKTKRASRASTASSSPSTTVRTPPNSSPVPAQVHIHLNSSEGDEQTNAEGCVKQAGGPMDVDREEQDASMHIESQNRPMATT